MKLTLLNIITALGALASIIQCVIAFKKHFKNRILWLVLSLVFCLVLFFLLQRNKNIDSDGNAPPIFSKTDTINGQPSPAINKIVTNDSDDRIKAHDTLTSSVGNKQQSELTELINNSEKADFAVIATTNETMDNRTAGVFVNWLKNYGTGSSSILQRAFIEQGYFNQILGGNTSAIKKTKANLSAKYICLVKFKIDFNKSKINDGLVVAKYSYEMMIVETIKGRIIDTFIHSDKSSGISEEMATQRAEDDFLEYLNKRKLSL